MTGLIILVGWLALLSGIVAGVTWHAYRLANVTLLTRQFIAELHTVAAFFSALLWGLPLAGVAAGICVP